MKKFLFCVYDSAAGAYLDPFVAPTVEYAIRSFRQAVNREGSQFGEYPQDYTLFSIGGFDGETGNLISQNPVSLGVAITFVDQQVSQLNLGEAENGQ